MELRDYQKRADATNRLRRGGPQGVVAPLLGLAGETGSILTVYKRYLRDGLDPAASRTFVCEELGDLLWYVAAVATECGLDLDDVADENLHRARDRFGPDEPTTALPILDAGYPPSERFPRRMVFEFNEEGQPAGPPTASIRLVEAHPNAFPDGPARLDGKERGYRVGAALGDQLTDNTRREDGYRFHDAIHLGFLAVIGWSPTLRMLLKIKRKSNPITDEAEDGARAIFAEEGLAAVLAQLAKRRTGFLSPASIDSETLDVVKATVVDFEAAYAPGWLWKQAINQGFTTLSLLHRHGGGYLVADLDTRSVSYTKIRP